MAQLESQPVGASTGRYRSGRGEKEERPTAHGSRLNHKQIHVALKGAEASIMCVRPPPTPSSVLNT